MKYKRGQSLFEVVIAIGVISAVLIALIGLIVTTQRNTNVSKSNFESIKYAQELTEWLRGQRDTSWITFYNNTAVTTQCFNALTWGNGGTCNESTETLDTQFYREANFTRVNANHIEVEIVVRWRDAQGDHSAKTTTVLTNWKNI